jgi:hypothetical protein
MTGCGSADPGRISEVSTERGTSGSGGAPVPTTKVVPYLYGEDPLGLGRKGGRIILERVYYTKSSRILV